MERKYPRIENNKVIISGKFIGDPERSLNLDLVKQLISTLMRDGSHLEMIRALNNEEKNPNQEINRCLDKFIANFKPYMA